MIGPLGLNPTTSKVDFKASHSCIDPKLSFGYIQESWSTIRDLVRLAMNHAKQSAHGRGKAVMRLRFLLGLLLSAMPSLSSAAELALGGLIFSDELGGVRLIEGWGTGTLEDPVVLVEEITDHGPAILVVRGMQPEFGNRIRSQHDVGFAVTKVVRNATEQPWTLFNLELREAIDRESPHGDGLSFGQETEAGRPFVSDRFAHNFENSDPYDGIQFSDGVVEPGETVVLQFVITDTTPRFKFYLMQKRDSHFVKVKPPEVEKEVKS